MSMVHPNKSDWAGPGRMQGWIIVRKEKLQLCSGLTLTAAERNLCEEEINQVSEARGHDMTMLSFAKVN